MKVRTFGLILLVAVGIVPLVGAGLWIVNRAENAALAEVRRGNRRVAVEATAHIRTYVESQIVNLRALGAPVTQSVGLEREQITRILKNYRILFPILRNLDFIGLDAQCTEIATSRIEPTLKHRCDDVPVATALKNTPYIGDIALTADFAPVMTIAIPVE